MKEDEAQPDGLEDESELDAAEVFDKIAPHGKLQAGYRDVNGELKKLLIGKGVPVAALQKALDRDVEGMSRDEFLAWLLFEREQDAKEAFVEQIQLHKLLASKLPSGNLDDPLAGVQVLSREGVHKICKAFAKDVDALLWGCIEKLQAEADEEADTDADGVEFNSKFATSQEGGADEMVFGEMADFQGGLKARIGVPHPNILAAIEVEHTGPAVPGRDDSYDVFTTDNYHITSTPAAEFALVADKDEAKSRGKISTRGRRVFLYLDALEMEECVQAGLTAPEVLALILYTGPMVSPQALALFVLVPAADVMRVFLQPECAASGNLPISSALTSSAWPGLQYLKYNAVLRRYPKPVLASNKGNKYVNTITVQSRTSPPQQRSPSRPTHAVAVLPGSRERDQEACQRCSPPQGSYRLPRRGGKDLRRAPKSESTELRSETSEDERGARRVCGWRCEQRVWRGTEYAEWKGRERENGGELCYQGDGANWA
eukprot:3674882-Rhodomonas_salina.1